MKIKKGVIMAGLQLEMQKALKAADFIWKKHGQELVITSALDGTHSAGSYHYYGYALDFRTRYFSVTQAKQVTIELRAAVGVGYTVLLEGDHVHIQFNRNSNGV